MKTYFWYYFATQTSVLYLLIIRHSREAFPPRKQITVGCTSYESI